MKPWYSLSIRGDGLSLVARLHEHRQEHHSPMLGGHMQRCDAVAAGFRVWCGMSGAQQGVDDLYVASCYRMVQHCVACKDTTTGLAAGCCEADWVKCDGPQLLPHWPTTMLRIPQLDVGLGVACTEDMHNCTLLDIGSSLKSAQVGRAPWTPLHQTCIIHNIVTCIFQKIGQNHTNT